MRIIILILSYLQRKYTYNSSEILTHKSISRQFSNWVISREQFTGKFKTEKFISPPIMNPPSSSHIYAI